MAVVALIPARGGSKGIPDKNLLEVGGKSLLERTVEEALATVAIDRVVVSTDSERIAAAARRAGAEVLERPSELAQDESAMIDVVRHAVATLEAVEVVVLLQPTSPLRRAQHVDEAVAILRSTGADAVVSVIPVPHNFTPESLMELDGDRLVPFGDAPATRQQKQRVWARNGPAVLVRRADKLDVASLYDGDCRAYPMPKLESIDIDDADDAELAELLLGRAAR